MHARGGDVALFSNNSTARSQLFRLYYGYNTSRQRSDDIFQGICPDFLRKSGANMNAVNSRNWENGNRSRPSRSRKDSNRACHNFKQSYISVGCKSCGNRVEHAKCLRLNRATSYSRLVFTQKHVPLML